MDVAADAVRILKLANQAKDASDAEFIANVEQYLSAFEAWQRILESERENLPSAGSEQQQLRATIQTLIKVHAEVVQRANSVKESVGDELGALHKRAQGLRTYVDRFPKSISITGKRKG